MGTTASPQHLHIPKFTSSWLSDMMNSLHRFCLILSTFYLKGTADMHLYFKVLDLNSVCNKLMLNEQLLAKQYPP